MLQGTNYEVKENSRNCWYDAVPHGLKKYKSCKIASEAQAQGRLVSNDFFLEI